MKALSYRARFVLIRFAKIIPFVLCAIVCISYVENIYSLLSMNIVSYEESFVIEKNVSWWMGDKFVYNWWTILIATLLSISCEVCIYNYLAIVTLCVNLYEKDLFLTYELEPNTIIAISIINIIITTYLIYKGLRRI